MISTLIALTMSCDVHSSHTECYVHCRLPVEYNHEFSCSALRNTVDLRTEPNGHNWMNKIEVYA